MKPKGKLIIGIGLPPKGGDEESEESETGGLVSALRAYRTARNDDDAADAFRAAVAAALDELE